MLNFYEDVEIGERMELGSYLFTPEDIVRYASQFDPQPFHLSDEGAAKTHFGRLCASGWHTASVYMKLTIRTREEHERALRERGVPIGRMGGSPGFKNLKWLKPVYAGDTISYSSTFTDKRLSATMPEWGVLSFRNEGVNQSGDLVFSFEGAAFIERREKAA
ncbi:MaoC family dehydratase [Terrarubrum flagellatum]|uniref:MaoC family dehydratase n=1 Tax=Terrirubrum flagellatum TaxID=2895980 RepID=UPI003144D90A